MPSTGPDLTPAAPSGLARTLQDNARILAGLAELDTNREREVRKQASVVHEPDERDPLKHPRVVQAILVDRVSDAELARIVSEVSDELAKAAADKALEIQDGQVGTIKAGRGRWQVPRPDTAIRGLAYGPDGAPVQQSGSGNTAPGSHWDAQAHKVITPERAPDFWSRFPDHDTAHLAREQAMAPPAMLAPPVYGEACGHANEPAAKFCVTCGSPLRRPEPISSSQVSATEDPEQEES